MPDKIGYAAPEVLMKKPYGKTADIWSLGVIACIVLFGAMLGELPYQDSKGAILGLEGFI